MYDKGEGVRQDNFKAAELFTKACDGGDAQGCFNLGAMYNNGEGVRQDKFEAVELFGKACDMRDESGCEWYARLKNKMGR
jgi:TPR repeat protein